MLLVTTRTPFGSVVFWYIAWLVTKPRLEPIISAELRLIAQAHDIANLESHVHSKAFPIAQPDTYT